jgi:hypothetical protein
MVKDGATGSETEMYREKVVASLYLEMSNCAVTNYITLLIQREVYWVAESMTQR